MSDKKVNPLKKIKSFFTDNIIEIKKIVWPTQRMVWKNTGIVLLMIFIMGVFIAALDAGLIQLLSLFMSVSTQK